MSNDFSCKLNDFNIWKDLLCPYKLAPNWDSCPDVDGDGDASIWGKIVQSFLSVCYSGNFTKTLICIEQTEIYAILSHGKMFLPNNAVGI